MRLRKLMVLIRKSDLLVFKSKKFSIHADFNDFFIII